MQKIEIHHLGSVKEFISDLLDMNLLIGEQATGKSTVCKSVYFFRVIKEEIIAYLYDIATDRAFEKRNRLPKVLNKRYLHKFSIPKHRFVTRPTLSPRNT